MSTTKTVQQTKSKLVKRFHTLLGKAGINDDGKKAILASCGVSSTLDLSENVLIEICEKLDKSQDASFKEMDKIRKQLMAAIYAYLKAFGTPTVNSEYVKAIACQAGGFDDFNFIPKDRLRSLIHSFNNQTKDLLNVAKMTVDRVDYLTLLN
jgi:hypothetical protein